jgi:hypothetical protein
MKMQLRKQTLINTLLLGFAFFSLIHAAEPKGRVAKKVMLMVTESDEAAIRKIVQDEVVAWNRGDAKAYSSQFDTDGTFTNIRGQFFTGYEAFLKQHEVIFQGLFKNSTLRQDIGVCKQAHIPVVSPLWIAVLARVGYSHLQARRSSFETVRSIGAAAGLKQSTK